MSKLIQARKHMEKAREITHGSTEVYRLFHDKVREELDQINRNRDLSAEGRMKRKRELTEKKAVEFLQQSHTQKQRYLAEVKKARRLADEVVYSAVKKPDQTMLDRFEADLRSLKTELMFVPNQRTAYEKLADFVRKIDDPYLAGRVRDEYAEISEKIMGAPGDIGAQLGGDGGAVSLPIKHVLGDLYGRLKSDYESEEVREARQVLEAAEAHLADPRVYIPLVERTATELLGREYGSYINSTDKFFEDKPELKPADYVDQEEEAARKAAEANAWLRKPIDNPTLKV